MTLIHLEHDELNVICDIDTMAYLQELVKLLVEAKVNV